MNKLTHCALALVALSAVACADKGNSTNSAGSGNDSAVHSSNSSANIGDGDTPQQSSISASANPYPEFILADAANRTPNELGRIPVLEYHLIVDEEGGEFTRTHVQLRNDLEELRKRGYVAMNMVDIVDGKLQRLPKGMSPVVLVFDDASPSQFRYVEVGDSLIIDSLSAVGILEKFANQYPDWQRKAVFCVLPAAQAGRSFFGDKGIEGQKTEWRYKKLQFLHENGYEICNHTLYHARLDRAGDRVQEYIARGDMAIDSALPGYKVRTFALPLGMWPTNKAEAWEGKYTDPKSGRTISYSYDVVLEVSGQPNESPYDPAYNSKSFNRQIMYRNALEVTLNNLDKPGPRGRYISDGDPSTTPQQR